MTQDLIGEITRNLEQKNFAKVAELTQSLIATNPEIQNLHYLAGLAAFNLGRPDEARKMLDLELKYFPYNRQARETFRALFMPLCDPHPRTMWNNNSMRIVASLNAALEALEAGRRNEALALLDSVPRHWLTQDYLDGYMTYFSSLMESTDK
jgi:tetratricopeptide (TPR) repeat protein